MKKVLELEIYKKQLRFKDSDTLDSPLKNLLKKSKKLGFKYLLYVYLLKDMNNDNPIKDMREGMKHKEALRIAFKGELDRVDVEWKDLVNVALQYYDGKIVTDFQKEIRVYDDKMDQIGDVLKDMDPEIETNFNTMTGATTFTSNIDIINKMLKEVLNLIQTKTSLIALNAEGKVSKALRGSLTPMSTGRLKIK